MKTKIEKKYTSGAVDREWYRVASFGRLWRHLASEWYPVVSNGIGVVSSGIEWPPMASNDAE